jgi:diamine N-acetyltransferase
MSGRRRDDVAMDATDPGVPAERPPVTLRPITADNRPAVEGLHVRPDQENFVDGVGRSLAEAAVKPDARPWCRAIYAGDVPVGFVMLADGVPPGNDDIPWPYYLWRFLIDARFQGRGYGRAALDAVVAHLRTRPDAEVLVTSVVPGDGSPLEFYLGYGFRSTGQMFDREQVLRLTVTR